MTLFQLVKELDRQGVTLKAEGKALRIQADMPPDPFLREQIRAQKVALLACLDPQRTPGEEGCPERWWHVPVLPPKGDRVQTAGPTGEGLRYRVQLFNRWYLLRFRPSRGPESIDVVDAEAKYRAFSDLHEFYRWAWAETYLSSLALQAVN